MALRSAWWMKNPTSTNPARISSNVPIGTQAPHSNWPYSLNDSGLAFNILEKYLADHPGDECRVEKYCFGIVGEKLLWRRDGVVENRGDLERSVMAQWEPKIYCQLYVITTLGAEALRIIGHHLHVTPRFFNSPPTMVSTGNTVEDFVFFSIQLFEQYPSGTPVEASRIDNPPRIRFRVSSESGWAEHEWNVTRIALIFIRRENGRFDGIIQLDPLDTTFRDAVGILAVKDEEPSPGIVDNKLGLCDIIAEVFYIMQYTWGSFLQEAENYLKVLSKTCVENDLTPAEQLTYTRELHKVAPLWVETRRRIVTAKDTAQQMSIHPFFIAANAQHSIQSYLQKVIGALDDHISRTHELTTETNILISLIFNIATLQDTRAAIEESRAANALASSIRRVTFLTFIYLPLSLAASIFGMNVQEISRDDQNHHVWIFLALAAILMGLTVGVWTFWSIYLKQIRSSSARPKTTK